MALFAHLESEGKVQINDRTRLDATKSFVSSGSAMTTLTIKPGSDASVVSVFNSDSTLHYLDFQFSEFTFDIDATSNKLDFQEGSTLKVATLVTGKYTLAQLATEIGTRMTAAGTQTYTAAYDTFDKLTITGATSAFDLLGETGVNKAVSILPHIGFYEDTAASSTSHEGDRTEYGIKKCTVTAGDGSTTATHDVYVKVYSVDGDALLSNDADLQSHEPNILQWCQPGRNTFKNIHRAAQTNIIDWLNENGYTDTNQKPLRKRHLMNKDEFRQWAKFAALALIFEGISNAVDDVFAKKAGTYRGKESKARQRAVLRIDVNDDGTLDKTEYIGIGSGTKVTR